LRVPWRDLEVEGTMKRRAALIGMVVVLAVVAAACGSGDGGQAAVSIKTLRAAVSNTQAAQSSRFTLDVSVNAAGHDVKIHGSGVTTADNKTGQFTFDIPLFGSVEARMVDGTMYMNLGSLGALSGKLPEGKQWVSVSLDALKSQAGSDLGSLFDQTQQSGPTQGLEYLQGLSGDVVKVGDDTVAGAHATHYRASIDYAKVAAKLPDSSSALAGKLAKLGTVPADVWINDDDRVVKMHFNVDGGAFGGGTGTGTADFTMEITDFGVPVNVEAPPADQTVDLSGMLDKFHQAGQPLST
jgi:hypothetical protein